MIYDKDILDKIVEEVKQEDNNKKEAFKKNEVESVTKEKKIIEVDEQGVQDMEKLFETDNTKILEVGDVVNGSITDISGSIVYVDLKPIGVGMVIGREAKSGLSTDSKLAVGSKIEAVVTDLYNEDSYIELSIREASYEKAWDDLRDKKDKEETVKTKIIEANKGGLIVEINGITGFLPVSQLASNNYPRVEDGDRNKILELLKQLTNKELGVRILDVNKEDEKLIVSEKAAHSDQERKAITKLEVGHIVEGEVSGVVDFGAFVKFSTNNSDSENNQTLEGLVHISEIAWQLIDNPKELMKVGDKVKAKIIGIDDTRISLSIKALLNDPWNSIKEKYKVGKVYKGKIDKINPFGAFVYLDKDIHGLAHVSEFQEAFPKKKLEETVEANKEYAWKVLSIESKSHRMGLVLVDGKEADKVMNTEEN